MNRFRRKGYQQGKQDAENFHGYNPQMPKSLKTLLYMVIMSSANKEYQKGYKQGFNEVIHQKKFERDLRQVQKQEEKRRAELLKKAREKQFENTKNIER